MFRRQSSSLLLHSSSETIWKSIHSQSRSFKPPALHVLLDTATNHRFSVATIDLSPPSSSATTSMTSSIPPEAKSGFLLYDSPAEYTNSTNYNDPVPIEEDSVAFIGVEELLTNNNNSTKRSFLDEKIQAAFRPSTYGSSSSPSSPVMYGEEKLVLTELDFASWFGSGQRDVISKNMDSMMKKRSSPLKIVCSCEWAKALQTQEGLEALLLTRYQKKRSLLSSSSNNNNGNSEEDTTRNLIRTLKSPKLSSDCFLSLNPGDTFKVGKREISFAAETWNSSPIFEDLTTRSIFSSSGLAGFFPWMELFSTPMFSADGEYLPLLSTAMRSHPPFMMPFWINNNGDVAKNENSTDTIIPFDARTSVQLVQYLIQRSPQRLFLQRYGMVSPADEFLDKLEINAIELVDLQQRLARNFLKMNQNSSNNNNNSENNSNKKTFLYSSEQEKQQLLKRTTERLLQCFLIGFNHEKQQSSSSSPPAGTTLQSRFDSDSWDKIVNQRSLASTPELNKAIDFVEESISSQLTKPFILGAQHLAFGVSSSYNVTMTDEPENESLPVKSSSTSENVKNVNGNNKGKNNNNKKKHTGSDSNNNNSNKKSSTGKKKGKK